MSSKCAYRAQFLSENLTERKETNKQKRSYKNQKTQAEWFQYKPKIQRCPQVSQRFESITNLNSIV